MPRKAQSTFATRGTAESNQPRKAGSKDDWAGFVPCEVDGFERGDFDAWYAGDDTKIWPEVEDSLGFGLKFSLSYDGPNQCFVASFSGRPDVQGQREFNAVLTARAGTANEAIALLVFKHTMLLQTDWWAALNHPKANRRSFG